MSEKNHHMLSNSNFKPSTKLPCPHFSSSSLEPTASTKTDLRESPFRNVSSPSSQPTMPIESYSAGWSSPFVEKVRRGSPSPTRSFLLNGAAYSSNIWLILHSGRNTRRTSSALTPPVSNNVSDKPRESRLYTPLRW